MNVLALSWPEAIFAAAAVWAVAVLVIVFAFIHFATKAEEREMERDR